MNLLDVIIVLILLFSIYKASKNGLTYLLGQSFGLCLALLAAAYAFSPVANFIKPVFLGNYAVSAFFSFLVIFLFIEEFIGLIFKALDIFAFLRKWWIVKETETLGKWVSAFLGFLVSSLILGVLLFFLSRNSLGSSMNELFTTSLIAPNIINSASWLTPLFSQEFQNLPSILNP